jgi:hypothetical protein
MEQTYTHITLSVIPAKAGIQPFYDGFLDSCFRRSDNSFVLLLIQTSIIIPKSYWLTEYLAIQECLAQAVRVG